MTNYEMVKSALGSVLAAHVESRLKRLKLDRRFAWEAQKALDMAPSDYTAGLAVIAAISLFEDGYVKNRNTTMLQSSVSLMRNGCRASEKPDLAIRASETFYKAFDSTSDARYLEESANYVNRALMQLKDTNIASFTAANADRRRRFQEASKKIDVMRRNGDLSRLIKIAQANYKQAEVMGSAQEKAQGLVQLSGLWMSYFNTYDNLPAERRPYSRQDAMIHVKECIDNAETLPPREIAEEVADMKHRVQKVLSKVRQDVRQGVQWEVHPTRLTAELADITLRCDRTTDMIGAYYDAALAYGRLYFSQPHESREAEEDYTKARNYLSNALGLSDGSLEWLTAAEQWLSSAKNGSVRKL